MLARPVTLITLYHTGAYSAVRGFRDMGLNVCAPQGVGIPHKLAEIRDKGRDSDVLWLHWNWIHRAPSFVWKGREIVTVLRDPVEIAISAHLRGHEKKWPQQARQWSELHRFREAVDTWIDFRDLGAGFARYGIESMPRENTTSDAPLKSEHRRGNTAFVEKALGNQYKALSVVWHEIASVFDVAGLGHRWRESMLSRAEV